MMFREDIFREGGEVRALEANGKLPAWSRRPVIPANLRCIPQSTPRRDALEARLDRLAASARVRR